MTTTPDSGAVTRIAIAIEEARAGDAPKLFFRGFGVSELSTVLDPERRWPEWLKDLVNCLYDNDLNNRNENVHALEWARRLASVIDELPVDFDWNAARDRYLIWLLDQLAPHDLAGVVSPVRELLHRRLCGQDGMEAKLPEAARQATAAGLGNQGKGRLSIVASITRAAAEGKVVNAIQETPLIFKDDRVRRVLPRILEQSIERG